MAATTCEDCGGKVNEQAWKCPHCGAKREGVTRAKLSNDEVRALVATDTAIKEEEGRPLVETLLYPHPETRGAARTIEIALTVACAPLVLVGIATMYTSRGVMSKLRTVARTTRGEGMSVFVMTVFGAPSFWWIASAMHVPSAGTVTLAMVALLWVRAYIRSRTSAWKSRELKRLIKAEQQRASQPALPAAKAKVVTRPSAPAVAAPTARPVAPPAAEPATPAGDEPRLLR